MGNVPSVIRYGIIDCVCNRSRSTLNLMSPLYNLSGVTSTLILDTKSIFLFQVLWYSLLLSPVSSVECLFGRNSTLDSYRYSVGHSVTPRPCPLPYKPLPISCHKFRFTCRIRFGLRPFANHSSSLPSKHTHFVLPVPLNTSLTTTSSPTSLSSSQDVRCHCSDSN